MILFVGGCMAFFGKVASDVSDELDQQIGQEHTVTYIVEGDISDASIGYMRNLNEMSEIGSISSNWTKDVTVKGFGSASLTANNSFESDGGLHAKLSPMERRFLRTRPQVRVQWCPASLPSEHREGFRLGE